MRGVPADAVHAVDAQGLRWTEAGSGESLLLIHGGHGGRVHWRANLPGLARRWHVLVPDLPGFGESFDPGRLLSPAEVAEVLERWLDASGVRPAGLIGFSFGSLVAIELAHRLRSPRLMLINPPGVGARSEAALDWPRQLSEIARAQGLRAAIEANLRTLMLSRDEQITPVLIDDLTEAARQTRRATRELSRGAATLERLGGLDARVRVLLGARDLYQRNDLQGRRLALDAVLGRGATRIVEDAAHWLQFDQPAVFADEVDALWRDAPATEGATRSMGPA
jgi:pimeloyl-ACP methyl ester carboxylesterase